MRIHQAQVRLQKRFANRLGFLFGYTLGSAKTVANGADAVEPLRPDGRLRADRRTTCATASCRTSSTSCRGASRPARSSPPTRRRRTTSSSAPTPTATATTSIARPAWATTTVAATRFFQTDLRLSKKVTFRRFTGEVLWEMFNVFNTVNLNNYQNNSRRRPASPPPDARPASARRVRRSIRSRRSWASSCCSRTAASG